MSDQPSLEQQKAAWSHWAATTRELRLTDISIDQRDLALAWLERTQKTNLRILEVGCGAAWLCPHLKRFGQVTATDLAGDVLDRARARVSGVDFVEGDFMALDLGEQAYDVLVTLEVLAHVADQPAFIAKLAATLKPDGMLILATQNRPVLETHNHVPPKSPDQLRHWVDEAELRELLQPHFELTELRTITPKTNKGPWRLINNSRINPLLQRLFGNAPKHLKERLGLGWTLMALAKRKSN